MESLLDWGIEVVLWFQQFSPTLDLPFKAFSFLGDKEFLFLSACGLACESPFTSSNLMLCTGFTGMHWLACGVVWGRPGCLCV